MLKEYTIEDVGSYGCIYKLTSPSGKCYIGQSWNIYSRFHSYKKIYSITSKQPKIFRALKKYGSENFKYEIIDLCESQIEMNNKEIFYIELFQSMNFGYNCNSGGYYALPSEQTKKLMSIAHKGVPWSEKQKLGRKNTNYKFKISKNHLQKFHNGRDNHPPEMLNKNQSVHQKTTISKLFKNVPKSSEHKNKLSLSKQKYNYLIKDTYGNEYNTTNLVKFCKEHNISFGNLYRVVNGYIPQAKGWTAIRF